MGHLTKVYVIGEDKEKCLIGLRVNENYREYLQIFYLQFKKTTKQTTIKSLYVQSPTIANLNSILFTLNQSKVLITTFLILFKPMKYMFKHYDDDLKNECKFHHIITIKKKNENKKTILLSQGML